MKKKRKISEETRKKLSELMKNLWRSGKIKPHKAWNAGKSTKALGKARPKKKWIIYKCFNCGKEKEGWLVHNRKFCSKKCVYDYWRKTGKYKGEKNPFWKGGKLKEYPLYVQLRKSLEAKLWKKAVLQRDNFTCQKCGQYGGILVAHHIFNFADFPELRFAIDNGITLCKECHNLFHRKYGKNNNTRSQLEEFLNS
jgi:hypothetical protein